MFVRSQLTFIWGFALGISAASMLFYSWHMESLTRLQQQWIQHQQTQQQSLAQQPQSQIETIDLLMKSYSISDGNEDQDMRSELIRSNHLSLLLEVQQQAGVDVTDLIDPARPFNSAQLYAALLRMKQQHEKNLARQRLDLRVKTPTTTPTAATP
ncbi:MAG: hypothetical protein KJ930_09585 [Gammaproteobacteria bacterium]|jgi:uncharacterized protein YlxW (UPF0749 family)|nr:hypothetical protein [Gammaproteobacteria bacterium]MBU2179671.1 hypothetical protein [Gammaproteobacteria bacterium]MBU2224174.1 hypothetical protein [Gammaproteobacteria bacterium]MBU2279478.1 hypothetical protein [Gammaproteobacteria bacterium]MBU2426863.1 hypothetical protein [Gammaproteobacteria bacterium]